MRGIVFTGEGPMAEVRNDVEVRSPGPDEVLVRIAAAGVCHSDVSLLDGTIPWPSPSLMGHEGAGVVEAIGTEVTRVQAGRPRGDRDRRQLRHLQVVQHRPAHVVPRVDRQPHRALHRRRRVRRQLRGDVVVRRGHHRQGDAGGQDRPRTCRSRRRASSPAASSPASARSSTGPTSSPVRRPRCSARAASACRSSRRCASRARRASSPSTRCRRRSELALKLGATDFVNAAEVDAVEAIHELLPSRLRHARRSLRRRRRRLVVRVRRPPRRARDGRRRRSTGAASCVAVGVPAPGVTYAVPITHLTQVDRRIIGSRAGGVRRSTTSR